MAATLWLRRSAPAGEVGTLPFLEVRPDSEAEAARRYSVVLHNDDLNGFDWVVRTLAAVLGCGVLRAFWLTLRAHVAGHSCLWVGGRAEADARAARLIAAGPDPARAHVGAQPLRITVEPMAA